jgi:hypothetical protein
MVNRVHGVDEPIGTEMFNSTGLYMGDWKAVYYGAHPTGKWQLYNIVNDPAQNNNVANQHTDLLQKMIAAYQNYSKQVGIVIPRGAAFVFQVFRVSHITPSLNQTQTVNLDDIIPQRALEKAKLIKTIIALGFIKKIHFC